MTRFSLIFKSARYHWRANLGAVLAAAAGCAVLVGALIVGDSVRYTLHTMAVERLGKIDSVLLGQDHFFKDDLGARVTTAANGNETAIPLLLLPCVCSSDVNKLRANDVQMCGVTETFWAWDTSPFQHDLVSHAPLKSGEALINEKLAQLLQVKAGDTIKMRVFKPGLLSHDAPLGGGPANRQRRSIQRCLFQTTLDLVWEFAQRVSHAGGVIRCRLLNGRGDVPIGPKDVDVR